MTTETTPAIERAKERLARAVADDLYEGSVTGSVYDVTVLRNGETFRDLAERIGSIAGDSLDSALAAALDVEEMARAIHRRECGPFCDPAHWPTDYDRKTAAAVRASILGGAR